MTEHGHDLLVASPERWDEACFLVPAVRALVASGLGVGVLCHAEQEEFWRTVAGVVVVAYPARTRAKAVAGELRGTWRAALVWQAGFAADVVRLAGIDRVLGPIHPTLKKIVSHPLTAAQKPLEHRVRHYLALVEEMGVATTRAEFFSPVEVGVRPVGGAVLLCPDSDFGPSHEWPLARWEEVAWHLAGEGRRMTVAGLDRGRGLGKALASSLGDRASFFEANPLAGALALLAVHEVVIAADGSLPHLAAHVGATCVTLFGPNDSAWKRPLGRRHSVVRKHVECAPCLLTKCVTDSRCQHELEARTVIEVIATKFA